jgi:sec-independent protein translocase protein TatC
MALIEELKIFLKHILYWICSFIGFSFFFFLFGLKEVVVFGKNLYLPLLSENSLSLVFGPSLHLTLLSPSSFSVQVFNQIRYDLLPSNVQLIVTNPMSAFVAQMSISLLLGFLFTTPLLIYKVITYLRPALLLREKKAILWSLPPFVLLFFTGCAFSYLFLIPETFKIFYPFATSMGVIPFFSIDKFIQYVFVFMIGAGLMFLLPLFVILLSFLGIIKAEFWIEKWRFALVFFLILSAIISPDVVTMILLSVSLQTLYFLGCSLAKKFNNNNAINKKVELIEN